MNIRTLNAPDSRTGRSPCLTRFSAAFALILMATPLTSAAIPEGIVWFGVLEDGLEEALLSGKPILLTSAAPQCASTPGMW